MTDHFDDIRDHDENHAQEQELVPETRVLLISVSALACLLAVLHLYLNMQ